MSCDETRIWCAPNGAGVPGLTFPEFGANLPLVPLDNTFFVSKGDFEGTPNGSISQPYSTIQAALDAADDGVKNQQKTILIAPGFYDEDLTIRAVSNYVSLIGLGPWLLGDGLGNFPCLSNTPRGITVVVDDDNDGSTSQNRSGFGISTLMNTAGETSSTFTAISVGAIISGGLSVNLISNNRLHEMHLSGVKFCGDFDLGATAEFDIYAYRSYFDQLLTANRSNLVILDSVQMDGLVTIKTWNRFSNCEMRAGMTAGSASDPQNDGSLPPSGMFDCDLTGTFTSLNGAGADPFPLDAATNFIFKANGAALANATKSIIGDLVP